MEVNAWFEIEQIKDRKCAAELKSNVYKVSKTLYFGNANISTTSRFYLPIKILISNSLQSLFGSEDIRI